MTDTHRGRRRLQQHFVLEGMGGRRGTRYEVGGRLHDGIDDVFNVYSALGMDGVREYFAAAHDLDPDWTAALAQRELYNLYNGNANGVRAIAWIKDEDRRIPDDPVATRLLLAFGADPNKGDDTMAVDLTLFARRLYYDRDVRDLPALKVLASACTLDTLMKYEISRKRPKDASPDVEELVYPAVKDSSMAHAIFMNSMDLVRHIVARHGDAIKAYAVASDGASTLHCVDGPSADMAEMLVTTLELDPAALDIRDAAGKNPLHVWASNTNLAHVSDDNSLRTLDVLLAAGGPGYINTTVDGTTTTALQLLYNRMNHPYLEFMKTYYDTLPAGAVVDVVAGVFPPTGDWRRPPDTAVRHLRRRSWARGMLALLMRGAEYDAAAMPLWAYSARDPLAPLYAQFVPLLSRWPWLNAVARAAHGFTGVTVVDSDGDTVTRVHVPVTKEDARVPVTLATLSAKLAPHVPADRTLAYRLNGADVDEHPSGLTIAHALADKRVVVYVGPKIDSSPPEAT